MPNLVTTIASSRRLAERLPERALRRAHAVALGGVEAVDAEVERPTDGAAELRLLDLPVAAADLPAAEADGRDVEPGPSEWSMFHGVPRLVAGCRSELTPVSADRSTCSTDRRSRPGVAARRCTNGSVTDEDRPPARGARMPDDERRRGAPTAPVAVVRRAPSPTTPGSGPGASGRSSASSTRRCGPSARRATTAAASTGSRSSPAARASPSTSTSPTRKTCSASSRGRSPAR